MQYHAWIMIREGANRLACLLLKTQAASLTANVFFIFFGSEGRMQKAEGSEVIALTVGFML